MADAKLLTALGRTALEPLAQDAAYQALVARGKAELLELVDSYKTSRHFPFLKHWSETHMILHQSIGTAKHFKPKDSKLSHLAIFIMKARTVLKENDEAVTVHTSIIDPPRTLTQTLAERASVNGYFFDAQRTELLNSVYEPHTARTKNMLSRMLYAGNKWKLFALTRAPLTDLQISLSNGAAELVNRARQLLLIPTRMLDLDDDFETGMFYAGWSNGRPVVLRYLRGSNAAR